MKEMGVKIGSKKCACEEERESSGCPKSCLTIYCKQLQYIIQTYAFIC